MEENPIFIGGPDRCGKTTLRAFLVSHPRIAIPANGSNMWTYFYGQFGDLGKRENFERCLAAMLHYKHVRFLQPDPERIRREFGEGEPTYGRLFALIHQHYAERENKPRWGEQTGLIERYADQVFAEFPNARMLHMIRDPRDRYQASLILWPDGKGRAGGAAARWLYSMALAQRNLRKYPGRYQIVRFESLVRETEQTLRQICEFLGEEYHPRMIYMEGDLERRSRLSKRAKASQGPSPLSDEFIGVYWQSIPKQEIAFIQQMAGRQMAGLDYRPEPIRFSRSERIRYTLFDWPVNLLRMVGWLGVEAVQHHMPGRFGRRPDRRMVVVEPQATGSVASG